MLEIRPNCEHCDTDLPPDSMAARICTFECTFCAACADDVLHNVCPNCGGGLAPRPIRPKAMLAKMPASSKRVHKPLDAAKHHDFLNRYRDVAPEKR